MKTLKEIILKHKIPGAQLSNTRHICAHTTSEFLNIKIKPSQINYKNETIAYSVSPIIKAEILIHQKELISKIRSEGVKVSFLR